MKKRFNSALHPASGHFFEEANGIVFRGKNWAQVIAKVKAYRAVNKLSPGNPEEEVHAQAIFRQPTHATEI